MVNDTKAAMNKKLILVVMLLLFLSLIFSYSCVATQEIESIQPTPRTVQNPEIVEDKSPPDIHSK